MTDTQRLMPEPLNLGRFYGGSINHVIMHHRDWIEAGRPADRLGRRMVMGFVLPEFQRQAVWTRDQQERFIESAWRGIHLGTWSYTELPDPASPLDNLLIDGQQRLSAIEAYIEDKFTVFGHYWSELPPEEVRGFKMTRTFGYYVISSSDEAYLREYYNLLNYGGVAHKPEEMA